MNKDLVRRLILYLADQLNDKDAPVSTIRLVKLLYLIDYEYFKKHQKTLTGVSWIRYHYGPYFMALPTILSAARIDLDAREVENERGKALVYTSLQPQSISEIVDFGTEGLINRIIERWCIEELPILLKHVYRTEPMKEAPIGASLDFSVISPAPVPIPVSLTDDALEFLMNWLHHFLGADLDLILQVFRAEAMEKYGIVPG